MKNKFYITTTLPYINSTPHIGFAMEIIEADVLARFHRELGEEVFFNTGTDEHGMKIWEKAKEQGLTPQEYADRAVGEFENLKALLNLDFNNFIRTTDEKHIKAAQDFWKLCDEKGYIYKKKYKVKYCVGCEMEKTDSELEKGCCPLHPNKELQIIEEENYFFSYSRFQEKLLAFYEANPDFVKPKKRYNEIKNFAEMGLQDFSISRLKEKMPWGVLVPGDETQVMYVWFDALVNYISAIGWPDDLENFRAWWPGVQFCGKDNLRPQAGMWQAMLLATELPNSKQVFVNGFINVNGQKMSKSLGNVISPNEMVEKFGTDGTRYLLLSSGAFGEDWDVSWEKFTEKYNADLANGIGNLTSRIITLYKKTDTVFDITRNKEVVFSEDNKELLKNIADLRFDLDINYIMVHIRDMDKYIEDNKPWEILKNDKVKFDAMMKHLIEGLLYISHKIKIYLPETSLKIKKAIETKEAKILFPRINTSGFLEKI